MKRFYKNAGTAAADGGNGYCVTLDGRPVRTPAKAVLVVPGEALAAAVAEEWAAQGEKVEPASMPLMRYVCTAIDHVSETRDERLDEAARYGATDVVCYRVDTPAGLAERQCEIWDPLLAWARETYGVDLVTTTGALAVDQPEDNFEKFRDAMAGLDVFALTALLSAVRAAGSLVIGLALLEGRLDAEGAFSASQVEETWQIEKWGEDSEAAERRAALLLEMQHAARLFQLVRT